MTKHREPNPATLLAAVLATENGGPDLGGMPPYRAAKDAEKLIRLGKRAARIALDRCNGIQRYDAKARQMLATWTEADEARADTACDKIAKDAAAILNPYGATKISVGGDPRGFTLKFHLASGRTNSAGGEGWGV
jgi:hypothetical protein